jgi:hypothetical protein
MGRSFQVDKTDRSFPFELIDKKEKLTGGTAVDSPKRGAHLFGGGGLPCVQLHLPREYGRDRLEPEDDLGHCADQLARTRGGTG